MIIAGNPADPGTPRFRWLNRWLEPRWRALLTWVGFAAITPVLFHDPTRGLILTSIDLIEAGLQSYVPFPFPVNAGVVAKIAAFAFFWRWFPPVFLRVGLVRWFAWIGAALVCDYVQGMLLPGFPCPWWKWRLAIYALALGLPALAVIGRRNRPWMALVAGLLFATCYVGSEGRAPWYVGIIIAHLAYGAVMLYGTDPLPRRPAETPTRRG